MSSPLDREALVAALRSVPGVLDADVDPDDRGGLGTLRLDLEPGVDEGAVAGQVSQVLRDRFGLGVDATRAAELQDSDISLVEEVRPAPDPGAASGPVPPAEPAPPPPPAAEPVPAAPSFTSSTSSTSSVEDVREVRSVTLPLPRPSASRPAIAKMHLVSAGLDVTASVTLASGARVAVGESRGSATSSGVHRAVATATLRAIEQLVGGIRVELEHLEVTPMGNERTVVVLLTLLTERGGETLTGAASVRDDVRQAVIRATLDALNRRLELLLTEV